MNWNYLRMSRRSVRGLHVAVPLKRNKDFHSVRAFARCLAEIVVMANPEHRTLEQRKAKRRGRVFVDTNRNAYAQTVAPAYAVRARPGAPVSAPLNWRELNDKDLRPDSVTIRTVFDRLEKVGDTWKDFFRHAVSLKGARRRVEELNAARRIPKEKEIQRDTGTRQAHPPQLQRQAHLRSPEA
jgi:bifunctional non-homologous end joining protein LigD